MIVFLDTNILVSAVLNPQGTPARAYDRAVSYPCRALICEQNVQELRRVFETKLANRLHLLDAFLNDALPALTVVPVPTMKRRSEATIRDVADRPILRAALAAKADILVTGDLDFLESGLTVPRILTAAEFVQVMPGAE